MSSPKAITSSQFYPAHTQPATKTVTAEDTASHSIQISSSSRRFSSVELDINKKDAGSGITNHLSLPQRPNRSLRPPHTTTSPTFSASLNEPKLPGAFTTTPGPPTTSPH
ncbi:hypothetical protein KEM48_011419 [Puccinia striiformis f. sp. tritici PST-130]|nr:hypothetical protein KEM48_011419 [Puccinia striiformis f. sp. tritici PST-130]